MDVRLESRKTFEKEATFYLDIPQNACVKSASINIKGAKFRGNIADSYGSTQEFTPNGSEEVSQITINFHSLRTINQLVLEVEGVKPQKCELKVWGGMSWFLPGPEYRPDFEETGRINITFPEIAAQKILLNFINIADSTTQVATVTTIPASESEPAKLSVVVGDVNRGISPVLARIRTLGVYASSFPSNVLIGLKDMAPLLVCPGELTTIVSIPDWTKELNEYLQTRQIDDRGVPIVVHTDTLGTIEITANVDYSIITRGTFDDTKIETIELTFSGKEEKGVRINIPQNTQIKNLTMDIEGKFAEEITIETLGDTKSNTGIMISPKYTISQQIPLERELTIVGIELYLTKLTPKANLIVEIRSGTNHEPSGTILAHTEVEVEKDEFVWISARFAKPITLLKENNYWIVLKATSGELEWRTDQNKPYKGSLMISKDEGVSWIENERVRGLFQLVFIPQDSVSPIELQIGDEKVDLFPSTELKKFTFTNALLDRANECLTSADNLTLTFKSKTSGRLKITNMLIEV